MAATTQQSSLDSPLDYHAEPSFLPSYLVRIAFKGTPNASLQIISQLMAQQLQTIAFENTEVQNGKVVSIKPEDFIAKIIDQKRGGYCYELNGLFALVLQSLGIEFRLVACRPMFYPQKRPKTHMAIVANIEGQDYLLDLGFGSQGIRAPIHLTNAAEIKQGNETFQLTTTAHQEYLLAAKIDNEWHPQYSFNTNPCELIDFVPANFMNSTHPDTLFVKSLIVLIFTATGKKVLLGNRLRITEGTHKTEHIVDDIPAALAEHFNLPIDCLSTAFAN